MAAVATVRSFNRTVTQRVGALRERYLARQRPLGEARLLWEIGDSGYDLRDLRSRLGLDSGYLSRLLASLVAADLITVTAAETDRRVRVARLTARGRAERRVLDRRSDELARSMLAPLGDQQRARLVAAMAEVERLLTAATVEITPCDPEHRDAVRCLTAYVAELDERFESGFDPGRSSSAAADELREPHGLVLIARLRDEPVGCGALKFHRDGPAEVKRMWVDGSVRGLGVGRRLLAALEDAAGGRDVRLLRLETNRALGSAIALYRSAGYTEVDPFNDEAYADHWFEKRLERS